MEFTTRIQSIGGGATHKLSKSVAVQPIKEYECHKCHKKIYEPDENLVGCIAEKTDGSKKVWCKSCWLKGSK
jgi:hypothetical protein